MFRLICIAIGYCIGCIQTAFIMGKLCKTDLSKKGSGNLGTTNALRVLGFKAGAVTFIGDILKGVVSFIIARWLFPDMGILAGIYACAGTILGHDFPFYLHFKGGKGIAVYRFYRIHAADAHFLYHRYCGSGNVRLYFSGLHALFHCHSRLCLFLPASIGRGAGADSADHSGTVETSGKYRKTARRQ